MTGAAGVPRGRPGRLVTAAQLLLPLLPLLVLVVLVVVWSVDVPFWDEWPLLLHLEQLHNGTFQLQDLWGEEHTAHWLLAPKLVMVGLAWLSGWDIRWEMGFSIVMAVCLAAALIHLRWSQRRLVPLPQQRWLWLTLLSLFVFNLSQAQNWFWGWQLQIVLCVAAKAMALSLLDRHGDHAAGLLAAAAMAAVASCSFASGLVIWPAALPVILLRGRAPAWRRLTAWLLCSALVFSLYLIGLRLEDDGAGSYLAAALGRPVATTAYLLSYLGSPLLGKAGNMSQLAGAAGVILFVAVCLWSLRHPGDEVRRLAPVWISFGLTAVGCAGMTALGRVDFGVGQALDSRYVTFANLLWIAVGVLVLAWSSQQRSLILPLRRAATVVTGLLAAGLLVSEVAGCFHAHRIYTSRSRARTALLADNTGGSGGEVRISRAAATLHPNRSLIRRGVPILRQHRLSCFRNAEPAE